MLPVSHPSLPRLQSKKSAMLTASRWLVGLGKMGKQVQWHLPGDAAVSNAARCNGCSREFGPKLQT
jgi:hypothetical protein